MNIIRNILFVIGLAFLISCEEVKEYPWNDNWNNTEQGPEENPEPENPEPENPEPENPEPENPEPENPEPENPEPENPEPENPGTEEGPVVHEGKIRAVWIDAAANFKDYANDQAKIASDMKRIKETGFTSVVVDVRPTNSGVLFKSSTEAALTKVDAWVTGGYKWLQRTETFDYLQAFIDAGKAEGLEVYASVNTMIGGCLCPYGLGSDGFLYKDESKKSWATVVNTKDGLKNSLDITDDYGQFAEDPSTAREIEAVIKQASVMFGTMMSALAQSVPMCFAKASSKAG